MNRISRGCLVGVILFGLVVETRESMAQFSADYQTNIVSGVTNSWSGQYYVGYSSFHNALIVQNSGDLSVSGWIGVGSGAVLVSDPGSALLASQGVALGGRDGASMVVSNGGKVLSPSFAGGGTVDSQSADNASSVIVTGPGSVWSNNMGALYVGLYGPGNSLAIRNGGHVIFLDYTFVGFMVGSSNNNILVADAGSILTNEFNLNVGEYDGGNSLVISNGGRVISRGGLVGVKTTANANNVRVIGPGSAWISWGTFGGYSRMNVGGTSSSNSLFIGDGAQVIDSIGEVGGSNGVNNSAVVTGEGSVWSNTSTLSVGFLSPSTSLTISNGGKVFNTSVSIGSQAPSSSNYVRVVDGGIWQNAELHVGDQGSSNSLVVAGGTVSATLLTVGLASSTCDNLLEIDSGNVMVSGTVEIRNGTLILNGGILQADTLVITNSCASFVHNGGTLIVGNVVVDPNAFRITSIAQEGNDLRVTWLMGPGQTNTLQAASGAAGGGYGTNGFSDIFVVTNNATAGTLTNFLDVGAATNFPSRFYRARLAP